MDKECTKTEDEKKSDILTDHNCGGNFGWCSEAWKGCNYTKMPMTKTSLWYYSLSVCSFFVFIISYYICFQDLFSVGVYLDSRKPVFASPARWNTYKIFYWPAACQLYRYIMKYCELYTSWSFRNIQSGIRTVLHSIWADTMDCARMWRQVASAHYFTGLL